MPAGSVGRYDYRILTGKWALWAWTLFNITFAIFANLTDLTICDLHIATGKCYMLNYMYILYMESACHYEIMIQTEVINA